VSDRLLVLFDRDCGICAATAMKLRQWDRDGRLELLALQQAALDERAIVRRIAATHALHAELHVVDPRTGLIRSGGRAFLEIASRLPGGRVPAAFAGLPPASWAIGLGYALVSRNRRAISRAFRFENACQAWSVAGCELGLDLAVAGGGAALDLDDDHDEHDRAEADHRSRDDVEDEGPLEQLLQRLGELGE
jgi:predicted DCC family thiol-disulfide oxidoreductase YuxK